MLYNSATSIIVGSSIILGVHALLYALRKISRLFIHDWLELCYLSSSFLVEVSLFLVLCQSIGKRGPQKFTIPVEYAYIPLIIVVLVATIRKHPSKTPVPSMDASPGFQFATFVAFLLITIRPTEPNMSFPGRVSDMLPLYILFVILYAVPSSEVAGSLSNSVISALCKCGILAFAILQMAAVPLPDQVPEI